MDEWAFSPLRGALGPGPAQQSTVGQVVGGVPPACWNSRRVGCGRVASADARLGKFTAPWQCHISIAVWYPPRAPVALDSVCVPLTYVNGK